jgi:magnesium-transporting ATPase (P-type)
MAAVLTIVIITSGLIKVGVALQSQRLVLRMASFHGTAFVYRQSSWTRIDTVDIVPGDIMEIKADSHLLPVDCVLIRGGAVADESSLTGEALPVAKFAIDDSTRAFDRAGSKAYMLFAGSKIAQVNAVVNSGDGNGVGSRVCAVVTDTGADTVKGRLVKDILYPTKIVFVFLEHLKLVFGVLVCLVTFNYQILWGVLLLLASVGMLGGDSVDSWFAFFI